MSAAAHAAKPKEDLFAWTKTSQQEQQAKEEEEALLSEDTQFSSPEQATTAAQAILGVALFGPAFYLNDMKNARNILKDPKLADKLFDFKNPYHFENATNAIKRRGELLKGKKVLGIRIRTFKIDQDTAHRATQAYYIAKKVHRVVENEIGDRQTAATISRYGLSGEEMEKFKGNLQKWRKDNPGKNIEAGLYVESKRIMRERAAKGGKLGWRARAKEEIAVNKEFKKIREGTVEQLTSDPNSVVARGKKTAERIIDPNNPSLTASEVREMTHYALTGETGLEPTAATPITETPPEYEAPASEPLATATPSQPAQAPAMQQPSQPTTAPAGPVAPKAQFKLPGFLGNIQNRIQNRITALSNGFKRMSFRLSSGFNNTFARLGRRIGSAFSGFGQKLGSMFGGLGGGKLGSALGGLGGSLLGGNGLLPKGGNLLSDGAQKLINRVMSGLANLIPGLRALMLGGKIVAVIIILAIGFPIIMTLFSTIKDANTNPMPNQPLMIKSQNRLASNWKSFEKNFLSYKQNQSGNNTLTWQQFEKDFLSPYTPQLSLE